MRNFLVSHSINCDFCDRAQNSGIGESRALTESVLIENSGKGIQAEIGDNSILRVIDDLSPEYLVRMRRRGYQSDQELTPGTNIW